MKKRLGDRYRCAILFCPFPRHAAVQLKVREPEAGFTTNWLCMDHAYQQLGKMKTNLEENLKEERKK